MPETAVLGTDIFDHFLEQNDLRNFAIECEDDAEIQRRFLRRPLPGGGGARRGGLPREGRLAAGGALVEPARGLPAPALHRRLRDPHAAQQRLEPGRAAGAGPGGDQARLRLDLLPARQGLPAGDALPAGGGEDGGDPPADRGLRRGGGGSTPTSPGWRARTTSTRRRRWSRRTASWRWRSGWGGPSSRAAPACASAPAPAAHPAVLVGGRDPGDHAEGVLGPASRRTGPPEEGMREQAFDLAVAEEDGALAAVGSTYSPENDVIYDGLSRSGSARRHLRPDPEARPLSPGRGPRNAHGHRGRRGWGRRWRSSSR